MTLLFIAFLAGILTVLSPCVLPLLPVIVGGTIAGGTSFKRALTVTLALGISVFLFTFLLKVSTIFIAIPPSVWNWVSGAVIFVIGIFFLIPSLWDLMPGTARANRDSSAFMSRGFMRQNFMGDVMVGAALGPVFSTCSPTYFLVLASVLPISIVAGTSDIVAYVLGLSLMLLLISFLGQRLADRLHFAADSRSWFRRVIGVLFILVSLLILTNTAAAIEAPLYSIFDETKVEQALLSHLTHPSAPTGNVVSPQTMSTSMVASSTPRAVPPTLLTQAQKEAKYTRAPELVSPDAYLNTAGKPITLAQYRGKNVVLLDFWTYSCINCQRTLPYLTTWYAKYKDQGLVIIGVHTPEFAFEHVESNVADALKRFGITYPVVLDNEYQTWNAYQNQFWPHEYVIDIDGFIVHDHIGEGEYDQTEAAIQAALAERAARLGTPTPSTTNAAASMPAPDLSKVQSPETYFGSNRNQYLGNGTPGTTGTQSFTLPFAPNQNTLYLDGSWNIESEYAAADTGTKIEYLYSSKNMYFVASGLTSGTQVEVLQDGNPVGSAAGSDVHNGIVTISGSRLYNIISNTTAGSHTLELIVKSPGLRAYTFTFG